MSVRPALPIVVALATAAAPIAVAAPSQAATDASKVVISEVYGGGGAAASTWSRDYVELYNPTDQAVDLSGTSVQYRSASGTANPSGVTALSGSIPAKGYFLVGEGTGTTGAPVPSPAVSGSIQLSGSAGTVFLANQPTALTAPPTGSLTGNPTVLDVVGYGTSNTFEKAPASATSASTAVERVAAGTDTDNNSSDFSTSAGTPGTAPTSGPTDPPDDPPTTQTIEEIQGTGDTSPFAGKAVTTDGVVTAAYPTGGFNGFYLQTAGTGENVDPATHQASDAVFVFGSAASKAVHIGDHVQVTGKVSEFQGTTEITPAVADVKVLPDPASVQPASVVLPRTEAGRESFEGMLLAPAGPYTVADNYALNQYGEIGLAAGSTPLFTPTEVADPHDAAAIKAVQDDNAARAVVLDDAATANFLTTAKDTPLPWLTQDHQIRVGAPVTFDRPVILEWRFDAWRFQPTAQLTASDPLPATFGHTRTTAPAATGGNMHIASMNVLNYFPTTGADFVASGGKCSWYDDRAGNHVTVNTCTGPNGELGPRGAADAEDLARQQAKIVAGINGLGADVVSLEEIENSAKFGADRDAAVSTLVDALNAEAGAGTWKFVPTPATAGDQAEEDVIRTAFIYRAAQVRPVGDSVIDDVPVFDVARDPLAQVFEPVGGTSYSRFLVIVNHFKSKGSGPDDGTGQGNSNPQRIAQAEELVRFADTMKQQAGTDKVFLSGDFNSYTREDPLQRLYDAGYTDIGSHESPAEHTYLFDGTVGSLDHVLGNAAAMGVVTGAHVWNLSSVESVALEYSRYNYNATDFYEPGPYRASDHDPLVVGLDLPVGPVATTTTASVASPVRWLDRPVVHVRVASKLGTVTAGTVEVREYGLLLGRGTVQNGAVDVTLPRYVIPGRHTLTVRYLGTDETKPSQTTTTFSVTLPRR
ncbi:ExeM/NucH family extracellular endonuclease [Marmoricola sp. URHB0036]|uniref:ExeM/NucH family extracellular endonuclease n=1 Tax=Marmoricola sp. URHB0036 TaxID=1298863 RepID=UPI00041B9AAB|nr:ExeM/NucH family extracellular endonuclease [Marmoricola sp. URHB0036]